MDSGLFEVCQELGVQPIGYSPLALGLLSGKFTGDPEVTKVGREGWKRGGRRQW